MVILVTVLSQWLKMVVECHSLSAETLGCVVQEGSP